MPRPRLLAVTVGVATLTAGVIATAVPASAATVNYVALGDSYSAGVGAGDYYSSSGSCDRSPNAYPALWAAAHSPASFDFAACSGATIPDVESSQLSGLNSATTLVSFTIGGNDVGFSNVMETCVLDSDSACQAAVSTAESEVSADIPGEMATLISDIRAKAPSAKIVVLDYPHLYTITSFCIGLSNSDREDLNAAADDLDNAIEAAAHKAGVTFADVRAQFSGHELCSGDGWLNSVTIPIDNSYHPTATGQADGYLPVFTAAAG